MPAEKEILHRLGERQHPLMCVAVVVVEDVLAPIWRRGFREPVVVRFAFEIPVEPLGHAVAAVRLRNRVDQHHELFPDLGDLRSLGHRQPIGQLHEHLRAAGLGGVDGAVEVVDRSRITQGVFETGLVAAPGVGEQGRGLTEPVDLVHSGLVGNDCHDDVAPFLGGAYGLHPYPRRSLGQRPQVAVDLFRVAELARDAHDVAQIVGRRRHRGRLRDIAHPGARKTLLGGGGRDGLDRTGLGGVWISPFGRAR